MNKVFYIIGVAAILASCSNDFSDDSLDRSDLDDLVTVSFGASATAEISQKSVMSQNNTPATRVASDITVPYSGRIGVLDNNGNWISLPADYSNVTLAIAAGGTVTTSPAEVVLATAKSYTFRSVAISGEIAPVATGDNYNLPFEKVSDGIDLIYGEVANKTINGGEKIVFPYRHLYGKVKFVLTPGNYMTAAKLATATLKISGYYSTGTFSLKTGIITNGTTGTNVAVDKDTEYYALPQTFAKGSEATAKVTIGSKTYTGKITSGDILSGSLTTINIKVTGEETPQIGDYYYSDKTYSTTYNSSKTCLGIVFVVNDDGKTGKLVGLNETTEMSWSEEWAMTSVDHTTDGRINMATMAKFLADNKKSWDLYPAFKWVALQNGKSNGGWDATNDKWYLPALDEVKVLSSVTATVNTSLDSFNARLSYQYYWTSTGNDVANMSHGEAWSVVIGSGPRSIGKYTNKVQTVRTRCIMVF